MFVSRMQKHMLDLMHRIVACVPGRWLCLLGWVGCFFATRLRSKDNYWLVQNIHRTLGLPAKSTFSKLFQNQVHHHQVICALETMRSFCKPGEIEAQGFENLKKNMNDHLAHGKGLIVVTAHIGSWELVAHFAAKASGRCFTALAKPLSVKAVSEFIEKCRNKLQVKVLWTDRPTLLRDMLKVLRSQGVLGFVMDQKPDRRIGSKVMFFGQKTEFVSGPAKMAIKVGSPVLAVYCIRTGFQAYKLICQNIAPEKTEILYTEAMVSSMEKIIRSYPDQWVWNYKRWQQKSISSQSS